MSFPAWIAALALTVSFVASAQTPAASGGASTPPPIIPVETMFKRAAYDLLTLSPNGKYMAATVPLNDRSNLVVLDMEKKSATVLTNFKESDVFRIFWANDDRIIYATGDMQGKDFRTVGGLYAIDRDGKSPVTLVEPLADTATRLQYVYRETRVLARIPNNTTEVLVAANDRDAESVDIYRMNIQNGRKSLVSQSSPGNVLQWVLDRDQVPRAALSMDMKKKRWWFSYRSATGGEWKKLAEWNESLNNVVIPYAFDPSDPKTMYVRSNVGRDTLAFFRFDPEAGKLGDMVVGTDRYDMGSFLLIGSPLGERGSLIFGGTEEKPGALIGVHFQGPTRTTAWFDDEARKLQAAIDASLPGTVNLFDPTKPRSLIYSYSGREPGRWYMFDREKRSIEDTGVRRMPWIDPNQMGSVRYVTYTARDGMKIGGYLTLPKTFKQGEPPPFVVLPHGGPWARDTDGFEPEAQFLANRGYAVLQPNFRGSVGYGANHLRKSYVQWGGTMTDDILDGVEWAIKEGFADKNRIGVYGASYGGFAALSVMVKRPDLFKWGINYVGVVDLAVSQDTQPAQLFGDFAELAKALNGDQKANAAAFAEQSPARHVSKISAPVFHAYGGRDRNVDFANGREIRAAFDKAGKKYEWMFVGDEAHGYRQMPNVVEFYTRFEKFIKANTPAP